MTQLTAEQQLMLVVCKQAPGGGFVVLNNHYQWTPVLQHAASFEAEYAHQVALRVSGYTKTFGELRRG